MFKNLPDIGKYTIFPDEAYTSDAPFDTTVGFLKFMANDPEEDLSLTDEILVIELKDLTQDASTYKEVIACQMHIKQMVEFLDYQTDEAYVEAPVQITVPGTDVSQTDQNDLGKYLQPSTTKVRYDKWTGYKSLTDLLTHLATLTSRGGNR